jgi:prepilin peptidase CpaA
LQLLLGNPVALAVALCGAVSAVIDFRTRRLPNPLTLGIALSGVLVAAAGYGAVTLPGALLGFAAGLVIMLPSHVVGATGAGDVKLLAAFGTFLGPKMVVLAFLYTAIAGGVLAVLVALSRRTLAMSIVRTMRLMGSLGRDAEEIEHPSANNRFAYAPAIAIGTLAAALGM